MIIIIVLREPLYRRIIRKMKLWVVPLLLGLSGTISINNTNLTDYQVRGDKVWNDTQFLITDNDLMEITSTGLIYGCWTNCPTSPDGWNPLLRPESLVPELPAYSLIGKIGHNGEPFFIGSSLNIISNETGLLYLTINDEPEGFDDNSGYWTVNLESGPLFTCE